MAPNFNYEFDIYEFDFVILHYIVSINELGEFSQERKQPIEKKARSMIINRHINKNGVVNAAKEINTVSELIAT